LLSSGVTPILYDNVYFKKDFDEKSVHIYIDVSGSTEDYWGFVYGLILKLKDLIRFPVYGFSTKVVPLELEDIKNGRVVTTRGTDFNCIVKHAVINNFKKILIVTDGYSEFRHENAEILRTQIKPYVVFIASSPHDDEYKLAEEFFKHNILKPKDKNITWWFLPCEER
jgi:vacuolar-type H+-ATPase subunit F/Vma7